MGGESVAKARFMIILENYEKNKDFPGLHSTIMTDSLFFDFLKQLRNTFSFDWW